MLSKPKPGDNWHPSASREGKIADAVNWVIGRQRAIGPGDGGDAPDTGRCLAANGTCDDFALYDAVQIDSPVTLPGDSEPAWSEGIPAYRVLTPESANARIAILVDPLPTCTMRRAIVSGICRTKVNILDAAHKWATVAAGSRRLISTADTNAPCEIIWREAGTGERFADVLLSTRHAAPAAPQPSVTPASPVDGVLNDCAGRCKFIWSASLSKWIKSEADSTCGRRTTTTGTSTTGTTGTTTEESAPCCPWAARESDIPTTTTTPDPEGTTTPDGDECDCLWPTFCGSADGQCVYTDCVAGVINSPPDCPDPLGTTTTTPDEGTTTCDCDNTPIPDPCSIGCDWVGLPTGSVWTWHKTGDGCSSDCPCPTPTTDPYCGTAHTDCQIIKPPGPPVPPTCKGQCTYWWLPALDAWYYVEGGCTAIVGCGCQPPSHDGSDCAPTTVPCAAPAAGSTTAADPPPYDPCVYACYGISQTSTTTTTTPELTCGTAGCVWDWNGGSAAWVLLSSTCLPECPCAYPPRDGLDDCETYAGTCTGVPTTTTTTQPPCEGMCSWSCSGGVFWFKTVDQCAGADCDCLAPTEMPCTPGAVVATQCQEIPPTTTTTTTQTTTTPPCADDEAMLRCVQLGAGVYVWELVIACAGSGDYDATSCGVCGDGGVGQICCAACTTTTTTTTTTPEATTTSTTTTTTPEPTTTTPEPTTTTTTTTCELCNASDVADLIAGGNRYAYQFKGGVYVLCDQNCDAGSVPPDPAIGCVNPGTECAYCNGLCDATTSTTTTTTLEPCDPEFAIWQCQSGSWVFLSGCSGGGCGEDENYTFQQTCDGEHEGVYEYVPCIRS